MYMLELHKFAMERK